MQMLAYGHFRKGIVIDHCLPFRRGGGEDGLVETEMLLAQLGHFGDGLFPRERAAHQGVATVDVGGGACESGLGQCFAKCGHGQLRGAAHATEE
jgi:hypothetical protein